MLLSGNTTSFVRPQFGKNPYVANRQSRSQGPSKPPSTYISRYHIPSAALICLYYLCSKRFYWSEKNSTSCPALPPAAVSDLNAVVRRLALATQHVNTNLSSVACLLFPPSLAHTQIMLFILCQSLPTVRDFLSIKRHLSDALEWRPQEASLWPFTQRARMCIFVFSNSAFCSQDSQHWQCQIICLHSLSFSTWSG